MKETTEDRIREITPHGGEAMIHTLISKTAVLEAGSYANEYAQITGSSRVGQRSVITNFGKVMENAELRNSFVYNHARVGGSSRVFHSQLHDTCDVRGDCFVEHSNIKDNAIISDKAQVSFCVIGCNARVLDNAKLYNVTFRSEVNGDVNNTITIEGEAVLEFERGWSELYPGTRVHEGRWLRPPLVIDTPVFPMIEGVGDRVQIGCRNRTIDYWKRMGKKAMMVYGLDAGLYDQFYAALETMEKFKQQHGSPDNPRIRK